MSDITLKDLYGKIEVVEKGVYGKIDDLSTKISKLDVKLAERPCVVHEKQFEAQDKAINKIWAVMIAGLTIYGGLIAALAFK